MKQSIFVKIMAVMLFLAIVPICVLGFMSMQASENLALSAVDEAQAVADYSINASTESLNNLGEKQIQRISDDVATQLDIYISDHPSMTIADLQNDTRFVSLATAPVGETGYIAVYDSDTLTRRFHPYPSYINTNIIDYSVDLPEFQELMLASRGGNESQGYFLYKEPDGSLRKKYGANVPVKTPTKDGVHLTVSSQAYVDEFSQPARETERTIQQNLNATIKTIKEKSSSFSFQNIILVMVIIWVFIAVIASYLLARAIVNPIIRLTTSAERISKGDLTDTAISIKTGDEIEELSVAFSRMVASLKFYIEEYRKGQG
jgi:HAMP domain-containing protein